MGSIREIATSRRARPTTSGYEANSLRAPYVAVPTPQSQLASVHELELCGSGAGALRNLSDDRRLPSAFGTPASTVRGPIVDHGIISRSNAGRRGHPNRDACGRGGVEQYAGVAWAGAATHCCAWRLLHHAVHQQLDLPRRRGLTGEPNDNAVRTARKMVASARGNQRRPQRSRNSTPTRNTLREYLLQVRAARRGHFSGHSNRCRKGVRAAMRNKSGEQ